MVIGERVLTGEEDGYESLLYSRSSDGGLDPAKVDVLAHPSSEGSLQENC